jgi:UDP-N-acetylmuramoyl-L-alanyl-D-glutamate--2,6-diaminopimelate ligase
MKIEVNNQDFQYISDNSKECNENCAFLKTTLNESYTQNATDNGCKNILSVQELKSILNHDIKIIAVTGTNGKTTTTALIYSLLIDLGYSVGLLGTRGFFVNDEKIRAKSLTTPMPLELYYDINTACNMGCEFFVMEISSHAIAQNRIEGLDFELKVHTNITSDHLDYHKTLKEYIDIKNSFFEDETKKVINKDDKNVKFNYKNSMTYSVEGTSASKLIAYTMNENGLSGAIKYFDEVCDFHSPMIGFFNLYNITSAVTSVKFLTNKPLQDICDNCENFYGVAGRMEVVSQKPLVIIDFAHTTDGIEQVCDYFKTKKLSIVFGAGGNRDRTKRPFMGQAVANFAKKIYITDDNPRDENSEDIAEDILIGIANKDNVKVILDRKEAIHTAINELKDDEVLLLLGKGDETTQEIKGEFIPFSDKDVVNNFVREFNHERKDLDR